MSTMASTYPPGGGSQVTTSSPGYGGDGTMQQLLMDEMRRRSAPAQPSRIGATRTGGGGGSVSNRRTTDRSGPGPMDHLQDEAKAAQLRAVSGPPPMRVVSGPGIVPGYMPDVNAMSGAQRQMFLPNNSQGDPDADARGEAQRRALDAMSFQNFQRTSGAKPRGY